jgi:hypothetical protein
VGRQVFSTDFNFVKQTTQTQKFEETKTMTRKENHLKTMFILGAMATILVAGQLAHAQPAATPAMTTAVPAMVAPMADAARVPTPAAPAMTMTAPVAAPAPATMAPVTKPVASAPVAAPAAATTTPAMAAAPAKTEEKKSGEKKDTWWQTLLGGLIQIIILFGGAIASVCGGLLIKWLASKAKISNQETIKAMEELYDKAIVLGVQFATQQANKLNNNPDAKAKRIKWATDMATKFIKEWKLPEKTAGWIEDRIEAKLGEKGKKPVTEEKPKEEENPKEDSKPEGDNG